ncbi:glycosyltransferase family 4 protein [archaeon]|jgi:glycosyltransferase involved in cell wall biosynthesis|nr:glycosyltransferase family 4 protein [archaeon]
MVHKNPASKNVAILGESYGASGKGLYITKIFEGVKNKAGIDAKLFLRDTAPYDSKDVLKVKTIKTKIRLLAGLGYYVPLFFKLMFRGRSEILHSFDERIGAVVSFLNRPSVVTVHDMCPLDSRFPFNIVFRVLYNRLNHAKYIIVVSDNTGDMLKKSFPNLAKKIITIPLGVDLERFYPKTKKKSVINIRILGNLDPDLSDVFKKIADKFGKSVNITLGGRMRPEETADLKKINGIKLKGFVGDKELPKYYRDSDIFVYKTDNEGFGLIPLEAMASGCAVVSSNVASLPGVIGNGGVLVENSVNGFYGAIKKLILDKKLRSGYQKKARLRAKELSWDKCIEKHMEIYEKVFEDMTKR